MLYQVRLSFSLSRCLLPPSRGPGPQLCLASPCPHCFRGYQKPPFLRKAKYNMVSDTEIEVYNTASTGSVDGPQNGALLKAVVPNPNEQASSRLG